MFLNYGTSLLVVICMIAFKLQSVNIDLFLDLFIFIQENACSQMYVDPNIVTKDWQQSFLGLEMLLLANIHKTPAEKLT